MFAGDGYANEKRGVEMLKLFVLFVAVPVLELYLLIQLGQQVGPGLTIGLVLVTGAVGMALAKSQGLAVLARLMQQPSQGAVPGACLLDGLFACVGGRRCGRSQHANR